MNKRINMAKLYKKYRPWIAISLVSVLVPSCVLLVGYTASVIKTAITG